MQNFFRWLITKLFPNPKEDNSFPKTEVKILLDRYPSEEKQ